MKSQLSLDPQGRNHIRSVNQDGVRIGDELYPGALIVAAEAIVEDWGPNSLNDLAADHFDAVLALKPEVVLLGTGADQQFLHPSRLAPAKNAAR